MPREGDDDTSSRAGSIVDVTSTPPIATSHPRLPAAQGEPQVQDNAFTTAQLSLADNTTGDNDVPAVILLRRKDMLFGRAATCDVSLNSLQISRRHCSLEYRNDKWFIRDLSTNGITVATKKVIKDQLHPLNHQDIVQLVPTGALTYRFTETNKENQQLICNASNPITIEDDQESLLSLKHEEDEGLPSIEVVDHANKKQQNEQDSVMLLDDSMSSASTKKTNSPSKRPFSAFALESSPPFLEIKSNKKQKTDIHHLSLQLQRIKAENEVLRVERVIEREEYKQKRDLEVLFFKEQYKEEVNKKLQDILESEFSCCICSCVFVEPSISPSCGHTYCHHCISEWLKKKPECPICRSPINTPPKKHIEMGNYINKVYEFAGNDVKEKRDIQIKDRQKEKEAAKNVLRMAAPHPMPQGFMFDLELLNAAMNGRGGGGRRGRRNNTAAVAAAAAAAAAGGGAGNAPPPPHRRSARRGRNQNNNPATGGLPGGGAQVPGYQMIPGMLNMNPPGPPHRGAGHNHPFFHVPAMPQNMTHQAMHNHFPQLFNNNQFEPFLHNDVLMID